MHAWDHLSFTMSSALPFAGILPAVHSKCMTRSGIALD